MIYQKINEYQFVNAIQSIRPDNFSRGAISALGEYLELLSNETGTDIELDVIALCCEFTEYENLEAIQADYSDIEDWDDVYNLTTVIPISGTHGAIIQQF